MEERETLEVELGGLKAENASLNNNIQTDKELSDTQIKELRCELTELENGKQNALETIETVRNEWKQDTCDMQTKIDTLIAEFEQSKVCIVHVYV